MLKHMQLTLLPLLDILMLSGIVARQTMFPVFAEQLGNSDGLGSRTVNWLSGARHSAAAGSPMGSACSFRSAKEIALPKPWDNSPLAVEMSALLVQNALSGTVTAKRMADTATTIMASISVNPASDLFITKIHPVLTLGN